MDQDKLVGIGKAASLLGVHPDTLREWEKDGKISSLRTKGNHRRYRISDLRRAESSNVKWNRFLELFHKYPPWKLLSKVSSEKALNEWLYFLDDHYPGLADDREKAKKEAPDEVTVVKYVLVMLLRSQMAEEYNRMLDKNSV